MTEQGDTLQTTKNALLSALGDNTPRYFNHMKFWFRSKWSKEQFDLEARKMLCPEKVHLHNQFLVAILNKIGALRSPQSTMASSSSMYNSSATRSSNRKRKRNSRFSLEHVTFEPYDLFEYLPENVELVRQPNRKEAKPPSLPRYCADEFFLPDIGFIMGRLLVGAWETGLVHVDDTVAQYLVVAVQTLLKNIISSIILKRKATKVTAHGNFFYDVGVMRNDPFVRNLVKRQKNDDRTVEMDKKLGTKRAPDDDVFLPACEELYPLRKRLITINDVYKVLLDRNIILSHSIHSVNMERMSQMLH